MPQGGAMNKTMLLAADTSSHVSAAAAMTCDLCRDSGDKVIVLHVHEFAVGRWGRLQVDCGDGEGERVVSEIVADMKWRRNRCRWRKSAKLRSGTSPGSSWMPGMSTTHELLSWAQAAARTCHFFPSGASRTGCCTRPAGRC